MRTLLARTAVASAILAFWLPSAVSAAVTAPKAEGAALWDWQKNAPSEVRHFSAVENGNSIAAADLGRDGVAEIIIGAGFDSPPEVRILRADGSRISAFLAYDKGMTQGVTVAAGDLDGDGKTEIVTGTGPGAIAHVRVFDAAGKERLIAGGFFPYGRDFKGGVNLAVADTDGDGQADIITAPGPTGGPNVQIWSGDGYKKTDFFAFDNVYPMGLHVAAGDLDGDGKAEVVAALAGYSPPAVRVYDGVTHEKIREFAGIPGGFQGGLNLAVGDVNADGKNDIVVAPNGLGGPHTHAFHADGALIGAFFPYPESYRGGVLLATGDFMAGDGGVLALTMPAGRAVKGKPQASKSIHVSIKDQRLSAYEYGRLVKTFLVATGEKRFPTPTGDFSILEKPYKVRYRWTYAPGSPDNYDLGWVTWNLRFHPHIYIHYAPWRSVFGVRGSHGCVNVSKTNAQWIYDWAEVRTPVTVEQ